MATIVLPDRVSTYFRNTIINHVLRSASASGSSLWMALYCLPSNISSLPESVVVTPTELSGSGYARIDVSGSWTIYSATGSATNAQRFIFPTPTADWNDVCYMALFNNQVSGSYLFFAPLSPSQTILEGDSLIIQPEDIKIDLTGIYSIYLEEKLLGHYLNQVHYPTPGSSIYLALYSASPSLANTGGTEISGSVGYSRYNIPTSACWVTPVSGSTYNEQPIIFTTETPDPWGKLKAVGIMNHPTSGSILFLGAMYPPVALINPDGFKFDARGLSLVSYLAPTTE